MNELENLKEIGIKEIARKTHIEPDYIHNIINKEFEKLSPLKANGYIKILQREYSIDLSGWLDEYKVFLNEHKPNESKKIKICPKIPAYTSEATGKRSSGLLSWILLLIVAGMAEYYFELHKYIENLPNFFEDENRSTVYSNSSIVSEMKDALEANITISTPQISVVDEPIIQTQSQDDTKVETNISSANATLPTTMVQILDQNAGTQSSALDRLTASIVPKDTNASDGVGIATIMPKQRVWIGIINLENGQKISNDTTKEINIDLSKRQLVVCGNGFIELKIGDKISKFDPSKSARFLVENGEIKQISYDEFVALNKGKSW
ncbi:phosphatidylglycerophosphate synthase [Campylobacter sp. faydin G-140]|uniref:phosphatidylglycerophosphate synthase n=1 Tax=Campylobacter anatolicus TaxID=2829105 RepID=UPI001B9789D9|nr:phosphatidylglycerophosphate synthase [Campylobacter anatolicus]MBR8465483.1 phosphatidylglycerophosphate synthase [Campylobacter anatolicus]